MNLRSEGDKTNRRKDEIRGLVFHIIHGSFVDGYGIRTTVFLKGCPLRCIWCCNPEGQKENSEIRFISSRCDGCARCIPVCPVGATHLDLERKDDRLLIDRELCTNCGMCMDVCYTGALDCSGRYFTVDELFDVVKKDEQYYNASGGGVTLGGGEPTFQASFALQFIRKCKGNYIHTALDTCGYTTSSEGVKALEEADLLLFDIKGMDPEEHQGHTGVSNKRIHENLKRRDAIRKPVIIRVPLIPGVTDSNQNLKATAQFLSGLRCVERVDLLAFHEYGKVKYGHLGRDYRLDDVQPISRERLEEIKILFERHGLKTQLGG